MVVLFMMLHGEHSNILLGLLIAASGLPLVALAALWLIKRKFWFGAIVMSVITSPLIALQLHGDLVLTIRVMLIAVVGITWLSGLDYVTVGIKQLRGRGDFDRGDAARLIGAIVIPAAVVAALVETPASPWPLISIVALELAVGGLDNLLSHHKAGASATSVILRVLSTSVVLGGALLAAREGNLAGYLAYGAALTCAAGVAYEFWRGRSYYLDPKTRDKQQAATSPETA